MRLAEVRSVVVQAGGRGTRLEHWAVNKPKCLLSIDGEPLLYRLFRQFPDASFVVVADHLADVLEAYLQVVPPVVPARLVRATGHGSMAGLDSALSLVREDTPVLITWCDLYLDDPSPTVPDEGITVGLTDQFECRWSADDEGRLQPVASDRRGVAGLFVVADKRLLGVLPGSGEFVRHLSMLPQPVAVHVVPGLREFGTVRAVAAHVSDRRSVRFFNDVRLRSDVVEKRARVAEFEHLLYAEATWYQRVHELGFEHAPALRSRDPLTIDRIAGRHPFEFGGDRPERAAALGRILDCLERLHGLDRAPADVDSSRSHYLGKTVDRVTRVAPLLPDITRPEIKVNGLLCRNPFHDKHSSLLAELTAPLCTGPFTLIHGDPTFSNILLDHSGKAWLIDPRGSFGTTALYGDPRYDIAKVLYSVEGNYDQCNLGRFRVRLEGGAATVDVASSGWEPYTPIVRERCGDEWTNVRLIHALIWLSLCGYAVDDVDSVLAAFYLGIYFLEGVAYDG